jgi:hypothetical protein
MSERLTPDEGLTVPQPKANATSARALGARSLLADMLGRGLAPTAFILSLVPLMQARLLGAEIGLYNIFNSPDSALLSGNLPISIPAFGWFSAAFFFVFFGSLIALFLATSEERDLSQLRAMNWRQVSRLGFGLGIGLAAVECAVFILITQMGAPFDNWTLGIAGLTLGLSVGVAGSVALFVMIHGEVGSRAVIWPIWVRSLVAIIIIFVIVLAYYPGLTNGIPEWASRLISALTILAAIWLVVQLPGRWLPPCLAIVASLTIGVASNASALLTLFGGAIALWMIWHRCNVAHRWIVIIPLAVPIFITDPREPTLVGREGPATSKPARQQMINAGDCTPHPNARPSPAGGSGGRENSSGAGIALEEVLGTLRAKHNVPNPNVIAVIASGGGYRATFWAAAVLDEIRARGERDAGLSTFARDVRVLAGASGGMVALAYMAEAIQKGTWIGDPISTRIANDVAASRANVTRFVPDDAPAADRHSVDSLHPVLQSFVLHDLASVLGIPQLLKRSPLDLSWWLDRGMVLEAQWSTLTKTFGDVMNDEACGDRPILVLSPMISQSGQPLVVSNLDIPAPDVLRRRYPNAFSDISIARAVRANASFPRVSPLLKVSPDTSNEHVTDAGFSDNLGMDSLVRIFHHSTVRKWMIDNGAKLIVVQIRAFPNSLEQPGAPSAEPACKGTEASWPPALHRFYFQMTSTIQSVLNARTTGNLQRAELQLDLLRQSYPEGFIEDVVFENRSEVSMSWLLPSAELECLRKEIRTQSAGPLKKLSRLLDPS